MTETSASGRGRRFAFIEAMPVTLPHRMTVAALGTARVATHARLTPRHRVPESKPMTIRDRLDALHLEPAEDEPRPTSNAIEIMGRFLDAAAAAGVEPYDLAADVQGGAALDFASGGGLRRVASVVVRNSGFIFVTLTDHDDTSNGGVVSDVDPVQCAAMLHRYLRGERLDVVPRD